MALELHNLSKQQIPQLYSASKMSEQNYNESSYKLIGQGGYGTIYKGQNLNAKLTGTYAVKIMRMEISRPAGFPTSLLREIDLLKYLNHPNIIKLRSYRLQGTLARLVFDFHKQDLSNWIQEHQISTYMQEIKIIMKQLLDGVAYMHKKRIIHRDIKPKNILIDENLNVFICDMGSGRRMAPLNPSYTSKNITTLYYRAPQILLGMKKYDEKVDLWSIGCVLAEMLVKQVFFKGATQLDQFLTVFSVLGTPTQQTWPSLFRDTEIKPDFSNVLSQKSTLTQRIKCNTTIPDDMELQNAIDLVEKCLKYNPHDRISAQQALNHPFFISK